MTFIHGIGNKTERELLERSWVDALRDGGGPDLWGEGVTTSMCYWADVLHGAPLPATAATAEAGEEAEVMVAEDIEVAWFRELSPVEQRQVLELAAEVSAVSWLTDDGDDVSSADVERGTGDGEGVEDGGIGLGRGADSARARAEDGEFERVPLPGPVKRRLMRAFLRDVHHYLWDVEFSPRPGDTFWVRSEIRRRALDAFAAAGEVDGPHVLVAHSLGSVIAYDVLQNVDGVPAVDGLVTVGSPLGLDEVQDRLNPGWSRWDGFPARRLTGRWVNVFDRLDPVCGFDPALANDFRCDGRAVVVDVSEANWGRWRHSIGKYLRGPLLRDALVDVLGVE